MSSQDNKEREIFLNALQRAQGEERIAYLEEACGSNLKLRSGIDSLLKACEKGYKKNFLEPVPVERIAAEVSAASKIPPREKGFILGDYELDELLGRGSTGDVYRALQISLDRWVALKILRGSFLLSESNRLRFRQEAESAARLEHPNIIPVYEVNEENGQLFFSMKLCTGGSLAGRMDEFRKDLRSGLELLLKVTGALQTAHRQGLIHRDVKPGNILLDEKGEPFLADFGLAKVSGREQAFTLTGQIVGTPSYMAPEQAGEGLVTTLTDVYGCGAVLYEMLCGQVPFKGDSIMGTLERVRNELPPFPSKINSGVDRDLEVIALKCLAKEPSRRFPSARQLSLELSRWLSGEPILSRPVSAASRVWSWCRRNPSRAFLLGVATVLALVLAIGGPLVALEQRRLRIKARHRTFVAETRLAFQLAEQPDGIPLIHDYVRKWSKKNAIDMGSWEMCYLKGLLDKPVFSSPQRDNDPSIPWWSPDGSKILIQYERSRNLELWDWKKDRLIWKIDRINIAVPEWSLDGDFIHFTSRNFKRHTLNVETATVDEGTHLGIPAEGGQIPMAWDSTHRYLAFLEGSNKKPVRVWDTKNSQIVNPPVTSGFTARLSWNSQQTWLGYCGLYQGAILWNPITKEQIEIESPEPRSGVFSLAWHPRKPIIASGGSDWVVRVRMIPGATLLSELTGHTGKIMSCAWSYDGKWLASGGTDHSVKIWDAEQGYNIATFSEHAGPVSQLVWAPKTPFLASGSHDGSVRIWDVKQVAHVELPIKDRTGQADWSPDGTRIVVKGAAPDSQAAIWDLESGSITELVEAKGWVNSLRWNHKTNQILVGEANNKPLRVFDMSGGGGKELEAGYIAGTPDEKRGGYRIAGWNPDGTRIAMITEGGVDLIAFPGDSRTRLVDEGFLVRHASWSPSGKLIAVAGRKDEVWIWDVENRLVSEVIPCRTVPTEIAWSPDEQRIAVVGSDFEIRIWNRKREEWMKSLRGHTRNILSLSWSPDGNRIASAGRDHTVRLWDADSYDLLAVFRRHKNEVKLVSWSPDGQKLMSVGKDKVIIWDGSQVKVKKP